MNNDDPIAFFITRTVYGTFLQGDLRGWQCINTEDELEQVILYVSEAQNRKGCDEMW